MDIKLGPDDDIDLETTPNDATLISGADADRQHWLIRIRHVRGEWFYNRNTGLPYYEQILKKGTSNQAISFIFRRATLDTPGIIALDSFAFNLDSPTRKLTIDAVARCRPDISSELVELTYAELLLPRNAATEA